MILSVDTKLQDLLDYGPAAKALQEHMPQVCTLAKQNPQAVQLSPAQLAKHAKIPGMDEALKQLAYTFDAMNQEGVVTENERKLMARFAELAAVKPVLPPKGTHRQMSIKPGEPWLDVDGRRIQAHGGAVLWENGLYYWYGENKEFTDGANGVWSWGIRAYSSQDLYNWKDEGVILPPVLDDPDSALFPAKRVDRPHILKCPQTGKYVCWVKLSGAEAAFTVWQADHLLGPYRQVENLYNPGGYKVGDFDLVADEATGKAYLYFDADHKSMVCMELEEDYLHAKGDVAHSYRDLHPPFTREAPCVFEWKGNKYMITSGMTGYVPNRSDWAAAKEWFDVFEPQGDPHLNDDSRSSFNSQISKVFPVHGKPGCFVAMADRWLPEQPMDAALTDLFTRVVAANYDPEHYSASDAERRKMYQMNRLETANTSIADYVWLPLRVAPPDGEHPFGTVQIAWRNEWTVEEL